LSTEQIIPANTNQEFNIQLDESSSDKIAFLQHSSGTTGLQKGVALSHQSVLNQLSSYSKAINLTSDDVIVSWLPLYHDMGLVAGFVMPLVAGIPLVLMSPFEWVRKPHMLLNAIHQYNGTLAWLPNFAYNHIARTVRPQFVDGVDLSKWRAVINCSEPVLVESHQVFSDKLSEYGFVESALSTCYAMAENTFAVTQSKLGTSPKIDVIDLVAMQEERQARPANNGKAEVSVVSCGKPIEGTELRVISDKSDLPERHIGEIAVRSNSMLTEYYHRPDLTTQEIRAGWYFTGDMGYIAEGELFITGRKKDLIIVGGKNIYPQDLEAIANDIEGIYPGRAVAFGIFDERLGTEGVVLVCELKGPSDEDGQYQIEKELRGLISKATEIALSDIRLVAERWVIKTSSGKIARDDNRKKYLKEFRSE
ncbi:MAG: AMP-binding protein, partial [Chloroflexota bacterium]